MENLNERSVIVLPDLRLGGLGPSSFGGGMPEPEGETAQLPLSHYLWVLRRHRWKMLSFVLASIAITWLISARITPIYESTATVDIDRQTPQGVVGQEAARNLLNDSDQFLATQIRLIQSDSVLRPVASRFRLLEHEGTVTPERPQSPDAPVLLRNLKVVRPPNTYLLLISYRSTDPALAAQAANSIAQSYLEHTYNIRLRSSASVSSFMERQLDELRAKMERSSQALVRFEREMNMINPEEKTNILSARLLQLNTEYTAAQADRVRKESVQKSVRLGSSEAILASAQADDLRRLTARLNEAQEKFAQVKAHFGANHPEYRRTAAQVTEIEREVDAMRNSIAGRIDAEFEQSVSRETMLLKAVGETKAEFDRVNARSFEYQSLKREAEADKNLYEELVRKIREAGINAGFQNSSVRLADSARPGALPVSPNVRLNLLLALVLSTMTAIGGALISDALDSTIRDPEQVQRTLNTEVIGTLPSVKNWRTRLGPAIGTAAGALVKASSPDHNVTGFEEAVRTLRNSILLSDADRRIKALLVTSASPGEGKSTTAAHLAVRHAEQGRRTLLIDGDLRRPSLHKKFDLHATRGLSTVLEMEAEWRDVLISPEGVPDLHILPAGPPSRRASELVARGLQEVLEEASGEYDLVILDAPPLLGFSEPLQMATIVDGVIVVARAGDTNRKAVGSVVNTLRRLRANVVGIVLNEVRQEMSDSYYYYSSYQKYYQASAKS